MENKLDILGDEVRAQVTKLFNMGYSVIPDDMGEGYYRGRYVTEIFGGRGYRMGQGWSNESADDATTKAIHDAGIALLFTAPPKEEKPI